MLLLASASDPHHGSSRILIPIRSPQTGKRRDYIYSVRIKSFIRILLGLRCSLDHAHAVSEPLYGCTGYEHTALQCILYFIRSAGSYGREQSVPALYGVSPRIHQQKATCAVRILRFTLVETTLAEKCSLLVTCNTRDRYPAAQHIVMRLTEHIA